MNVTDKYLPYCTGAVGNPHLPTQMVQQADDGYECGRCGNTARGISSDWVKNTRDIDPFAAPRLSASKAAYEAKVDEFVTTYAQQELAKKAEGAELEKQVAQFNEWWLQLAQVDLEGVLAKALEYSSSDLKWIGRITAEMIGWDGTTDAEAVQIGCWWYLLGKIGRAVGAIKEHRLPSEDTAKDTAIYATMVRRVLDVGAWPGLGSD